MCPEKFEFTIMSIWNGFVVHFAFFKALTYNKYVNAYTLGSQKKINYKNHSRKYELI